MNQNLPRRHFPAKTTCPECASRHHVRSGNSRNGDIQYRACPKGHTYKVFPIAIEEDLGGLVSVLRVL